MDSDTTAGPLPESQVTLSESEVTLYLAMVRLHFDTSSPFFGNIAMDELMDRPLSQQKQVYDAMPVDLRLMVEAQHTQ